MLFHKNKIAKLLDVLMLIAGNALLAFDVAAFIIPHDFILGGTTGLALFAGNLILGIDTAMLVLIMNVALLLVGRILLGRKLFFSTAVSSVLYPLMLEVFQRIPGIASVTDNTLLAALFGGSLMGIALGLVMRVGASTGGMDIVSLLMNKYLHWPVSTSVWITDAAVILLQAVFAPAESTLYAIIILVTESMLLDRLMLIGLSQIQVFAVSDCYESIRRALLKELDAGVTMIHIETGALCKQGQGVLCVLPPRKLFDAVNLIQRIDPAAFLTVTQIKEAKGRGYTLEQADVDLGPVLGESAQNARESKGEQQ